MGYMKATLKNYRQSPRKVRLVADCIRGKRVDEALSVLRSIDKKASLPLVKLLNSAVSNARQESAGTENLTIAHLTVDAGLTLKRFRPHVKGKPRPIRRRTSTISLELQ